MLDMGFQPQVDRILRTVPKNRQTMLFSATLDGAVAKLADAYTVNPVQVEAELPAQAERGEVDHTFVPVTADDKLGRLVEQLDIERGLALVFVRTKHGADKLARKLSRQHDIPAAAMHGNMSQNARERALCAVRVRPRLDARRNRRRRSRSRRERHHPRDQLRSAAGRRRLRPPRSAAPAGPDAAGAGVTLVLPEQRNDVGRLAARLGHRRQFDASGMTVATRPSNGSGRPSGPGQPRRRRRR